MHMMPSSWSESPIEVPSCLKMLPRTRLMVAEAAAAVVVMAVRLQSNGRVEGPVATHLCRCGWVHVSRHANLKMIQKLYQRNTQRAAEIVLILLISADLREKIGGGKRNWATN
jgi:hypothetical protein